MADALLEIPGRFEELLGDAVTKAGIETAAAEWAVTNGMLMKGVGGVVHTPTTLHPTQFPAAELAKAVKVQANLNVMLHNLRQDHAFLIEVLEDAAGADAFTGRLLELYRTFRATPAKQPLSLSVHRTDYLLDSSIAGQTPCIKQVEINTISCAFGGLAGKPVGLHRYLADKFIPDVAAAARGGMADSTTLPRLAAAMANAVAEYSKRRSGDGAPSAGPTAVCMIIQAGEANAFDQRLLEYALHETHGVQLVRRSMKEIHDEGYIDPSSGVMVIDGLEIGLCYYRAGYIPEDYPTDAEWAARLAVEQSLAIKCPSLADHLTGTKKMQQVLAQPGMVERFTTGLDDATTAAAAIRETFTGLYELGNTDAGEAAKDKALAEPGRYVLKPQREGGGNNLYGDDLVQALTTMSLSDREGFILMDLIAPSVYRNAILREGVATVGSVVSELGVFGVCLSDSTVGADTVVHSDAPGTLLRTKLSHVLDGGVASGRAVLDSPLAL